LSDITFLELKLGEIPNK